MNNGRYRLREKLVVRMLHVQAKEVLISHNVRGLDMRNFDLKPSTAEFSAARDHAVATNSIRKDKVRKLSILTYQQLHNGSSQFWCPRIVE